MADKISKKTISDLIMETDGSKNSIPEGFEEVTIPDGFEEVNTTASASPIDVLGKIGRSVGSGVSGLAQGLSLGTADELTAGLSVPSGMLENLIAGRQVPGIGEQYKLNIEAQRAREAAQKAENPLEYMGAEAVGAVAPALVSGGLGLAKTGIQAAAPMIKQAIAPAKKAGLDLAAEVMKRVGGGAAQGATAGVGYSNADTPAGAIDAALLPAAIGGAIPGLGAAGRFLKNKTVDFIGKPIASILSGVPESAINTKVAMPGLVERVKTTDKSDIAQALFDKVESIKKSTGNTAAKKVLKDSGKRYPVSNIIGEINDSIKKVKSDKIFANSDYGKSAIQELEKYAENARTSSQNRTLSLLEVMELNRLMRKGVSYGEGMHGFENEVNNRLKEAAKGVDTKLKQYAEIHAPEFKPIMKDLYERMQALGDLAGKDKSPEQLYNWAKTLTDVGTGKSKATTASKQLLDLEKYGIMPELQAVQAKEAAEKFAAPGGMTGYFPGIGMGGGVLMAGGQIAGDIASGKDIDVTKALASGAVGLGGGLLARKYGGRVSEKIIDSLAQTRKGQTSPMISTAAQRAAIQQLAKTGEKKPMSEIPE